MLVSVEGKIIVVHATVADVTLVCIYLPLSSMAEGKSPCIRCNGTNPLMDIAWAQTESVVRTWELS